MEIGEWQMEGKKSAIEEAREYGVDIEQLRAFWQLTPAERLDQLQAMVDFIVTAHESIRLQKEKAKGERESGIQKPATVAG